MSLLLLSSHNCSGCVLTRAPCSCWKAWMYNALVAGIYSPADTASFLFVPPSIIASSGMLHNMVAKKIPAKKPVSSVEKNRPKNTVKSSVETNRSKTPQAKAAARTDAKGRTGMGSSTASGKKPIPKDFGKREERLRGIQLSAMLGGKATGAATRNSYTLGKTVVHSSPAQGLKSISPRTGSYARPNESVAFGSNTKNNSVSNIISNAQQFVNRGGTPGSHYIGKVRRKDIVGISPTEVVSKGPIKVVKEIKSKGNIVEDAKNLSQALKKSTPKSVKNATKKKK